MYTGKILLFALCLCLGYCEDDGDYCQENVIKSEVSSSDMQFTKETTTREYAVIGDRKNLHCCAKGYRSIEWRKDGVFNPWPGTVSTFILYPKSANQTIFSVGIKLHDRGNYTCILRNDSVVIEHKIQLEIYDDDNTPAEPQVTYAPPQTVQVPLEKPVRLFCEGFVGRRYRFPDAKYDVTWTKNHTAVSGPGIRTQYVEREPVNIGAYLFIDRVQPHHYGTYVCSINKPGKSRVFHVELREKVPYVYVNPNPAPVKQILIAAICISMILVLLTFIYKKYSLVFRVYVKDHVMSAMDNIPYNNDILIVYSSDDDETFVFMLMNILTTRYHYTCSMKKQEHFIENRCTPLNEEIRQSQHMITVISPTTVERNWTAKHLYASLKNLEHFGTKLTCVLLAEPPKCDMVKNSIGETLTTLLKKMNVIQWTRNQEDNNNNFWLSLRLNLPAIRRTGMSANLS